MGAYRLRARLRRLSSSDGRDRACGVVTFGEGGCELVCRGRPGAWATRWAGVVTCRRIWSCPVCSRRLRGERWTKVVGALRGLRGRWQMVTLTVRHDAGDELGPLLGGMMSAWRRLRQGTTIQETWADRVTASVRATEIKDGAHGWHPHLHVLLRTSEWSVEERAALALRWRAVVVRELGAEHAPSSEHGIRWSRPLELGAEHAPLGVDEAELIKAASYLAAVGAELTGTDGSKGVPWELAERASDGDERAAARWAQYRAAVKGRRMIELDDRAARAARSYVDPDAVAVCESELAQAVAEVAVPIDVDRMGLLRRWEWSGQDGVLGALLADVRASHAPEPTVRAWLALAEAWDSGPRRARIRARAGPACAAF